MDSGTASLIGVFVGALITTGVKGWDYWSAKRTAGRYLATRVTTTLDHFIFGCVLVAGDDGKVLPDGGIAAEARLPDLQLEKLDVDWKSIHPHLAYPILALPNEIVAAVHIINSKYDPIAIPYHDFDERKHQFARLGLIAGGLVERLLPVGGLPGHSPIRQQMLEKLDAVLADVERRREYGRKMMADLAEKTAEMRRIAQEQALREIAEQNYEPK